MNIEHGMKKIRNGTDQVRSLSCLEGASHFRDTEALALLKELAYMMEATFT
jgi:hypothetical protein